MYSISSPFVRSRSTTPLTADISRLVPDLSDHSVSNHMVRPGSSLGHAKYYFNSARQDVYPRYSTTEWDASNKAKYNLSDCERRSAERLRADACQIVKSAEHQTRLRQSSNTKKLATRVSDIMFWKDELMKEINLMESETVSLEDHKHLLEKAFQESKHPLSIAENCLIHRERRTGIDLVKDNVESHLTREIELIKRCQKKMQGLIARAEAQVKMNRASQKMCENDVKQKHHAQGLDDRMQILRNTSGQIGFHPGIETVDNTITIPMTWTKYTQENIRRSQKEREASEKIRAQIDDCIRSCANEMWSQFNNVNNAFTTRIQETNNAKNNLQSHLQRTNAEIRDLERTAESLRRAIFDKEAPMKVAQTRLDERNKRIHVELCNDNVMSGLQREVYEIREAVRVLKEKLRQVTIALNRLLKTRATIERDITVKENSLEIDSKICMGSRKGMPMDPKIAPVFSMPVLTY